MSREEENGSQRTYGGETRERGDRWNNQRQRMQNVLPETTTTTADGTEISREEAQNLDIDGIEIKINGQDLPEGYARFMEASFPYQDNMDLQALNNFLSLQILQGTLTAPQTQPDDLAPSEEAAQSGPETHLTITGVKDGQAVFTMQTEIIPLAIQRQMEMSGNNGPAPSGGTPQP